MESLLEEIDRKWQSSNQSTASDVRIKYIKFTSDKERKILSFTGKVDKVEISAKDFETGRDIPDKYVTRYVFECYDMTGPNPRDNNGIPSIWECGTKDARIIFDGCHWWILMRGHGFINQTQEFIKGYYYGFCSDPSEAGGGGSDAEQADIRCDDGPNGVRWALPGSLDHNNTRFWTPN